MRKTGKIILWAVLFWLATTEQTWAAVISESDMIDAVKKEFVEQGVDETLDVEFFGGQSNFSIEEANSLKVMISRLKYDAGANKFSADAEIFADGQVYAKTTLSGRYYVLEEAWVPVRNIEKGDVITKDKLQKIQVRANRLKGQHITDAEKLDGMEAKRSLKAGKLISDRDVGAVIVVKKGKVVTSVYKASGLQITAQAEALEDGAKGQNIELFNTKSGKKFVARVIDAETVEIDAQAEQRKE